MPQETDQREPNIHEQVPDPGKNNTAKSVVILLIALLAVGAAVYSGMRVQRQEQERRVPGEESGDAAYQIPAPVGSDDAKVKLVMILGQCVAPAMDGFVAVAKAWPDRIHADFYAYESDEGRALLKAHDENIACIFVNDKNHFTLKTGDDEREVTFRGPPDETFSLSDVAEALRMEMLEAYGDLPPDFDEVTSRIRGQESRATDPDE